MYISSHKRANIKKRIEWMISTFLLYSLQEIQG